MIQYTIGADLGGKSLKSALVDDTGNISLRLVDDTGNISLRLQDPVNPQQSAQEIARLLIEQVRTISESAQKKGTKPAALGLAVPGYLDQKRSKITFSANLPNLNNSDLVGRIKDSSDLPVYLDADSNAAAWGEYRFGAGKNINRLIVATIGTGIGAGVIIDGQILRIRNHTAGSLGHVIIDAKGPRCPCGASGCLEALASASALEKLAEKLAQSQKNSALADILTKNGKMTAKDVNTALTKKDPAAKQAVNQCGWWLGAGLASWSAIFNPQKTIITGGLANLAKPWFDAINAGLNDTGQPNLTKSLTVIPAALDQNAGIIGAANLALLNNKFL